MLQVMNNPFTEEQIKQLNQLLPSLTEAQQIWLSGYFSGALQIKEYSTPSGNIAVQEVSVPETNVMTKEVTILYGSQTGNGQGLAESLTKKLKDEEYQVTLTSMSDFKYKSLSKIKNLLVIVSTHGEGDPPDNAIQFHEFLHGKRAPNLQDLHYSVLSLGDSSYEFFCQTGKEFDERLQELGAKQLTQRIDCDLDFDEPAAEWFTRVLFKLNEQQVNATASTSPSISPSVSPEQTEYSRTNPFKAEILENININGRGSNKETRHLELSLEGSNLHFEPGDSIGIYPENDPELVDAFIAEMEWNPEVPVPVNKQGVVRSLREALISNFEITVLTKPLMKKIAELTSNAELEKLVDQKERLDDYIDGRDLLDVAKDFSLGKVDPKEFVGILRKIPARLYSIASSLQAAPDEVHVTIGTVRYESHGRSRLGVCSGECALRLEEGDTVPVYIQRNDNFKLPENPDTPIIMIGPGTGIAPFRSFMQEREEIEAKGKTWLFFGEQHYRTDFLYQVEWQQWLKNGVLTKMDVAFSRDTDEKVYVQHKMLEKSKEVYEWLEDGAVIYVCGDEKHMAADVQKTLVKILEAEGRLNAEEARDYLANLQQQKRYQRDVY